MMIAVQRNAYEKLILSILVNYDLLKADTGEYKRAKCINENVAARIGPEEYEDVLFNEKYIIHEMNRIDDIYLMMELKYFHMLIKIFAI